MLASSPSYNPNAIEKNFSAVERLKTSACAFAAPLLDRATQGLYPPGSTFKVVTASAALDSGAFKPDSTFQDPGYCTEYGKQVSNAGNPDQNGPESFGTVTLAQGLQHSINSVYCNIGKKIGAGTILDYTKRFGFYSPPDLELPLDAQSPSGLYNPKTHKLLWPKHPETQVDPGRLAFGQERLLVTPVQMAMVAATIANGGVLMRPHLIDEIRAPNGSVVERVKPQKGIAYFVVGSGGELRKGNIDRGSGITAKGFDTDQAFMAAEITGDQMYFNAISRGGQTVDSGVLTRRKP